MSVENTAITNLTLSKCFKQFGVNVHVYGTVEEPLFLAKEICQAVGIKQHRKKISGLLDVDEVSEVTRTLLGYAQTMSAVTESGVYKILLTCRAAKIKGTPANLFMNWVVKVILPSIRRTGSFEINRLNAQVEQLTEERDTIIRRVEVSPFKLLVAQITGAPYTTHWKRSQVVCDIVFNVWHIAKEQNRVEKLTLDACWTFTSTQYRDTWNAFIQQHRV